MKAENLSPTEPRVCVIMSMLNAERTLPAALRSLRAQTLEDWQLIVFDDGSWDRSPAIVEAFGDSRVRLFRDGKTVGLASRLNQAIALAQGQFIARMDADDVCYPERFERQCAFLEARPEVDLVGSGAMVFDRNGASVGLLPVRVTHERICEEPWKGFYLAHPTWMARREWFGRWVYRADLFRAQDQDLLLRSHSTSHFACLEEPLLGYRQAGVSLNNSLRGRYHYIRALWRYGAMTRNPWLMIKGTAIQCLRACALTVGLALFGEDRVLTRRTTRPSDSDIVRWEQVKQLMSGPTSCVG